MGSTSRRNSSNCRRGCLDHLQGRFEQRRIPALSTSEESTPRGLDASNGPTGWPTLLVSIQPSQFCEPKQSGVSGRFASTVEYEELCVASV